ncbi:hypothetical protein [Streptomyces sp. 5-10]|uniref:hypothetical protein n=1 Tax=Streptomyces sp. 5-10 TaxID=878925 RepID=UPI00168B231F|nr:hypothetical protein [Streptomyces sp. 5-10]MBD3004594.1 hypothetical protein [Streptomyces sp. 5-10]
MSDFSQIEIYSDGSTHTLYEFCGFDDCRRKILEALGLTGKLFSRDVFWTATPDTNVRLTVSSLDDSDRCVWCYGCGDFLRHANASPEPGGGFFGCECEDSEEDREPLEPMVEVNGRLELRPFR